MNKVSSFAYTPGANSPIRKECLGHAAPKTKVDSEFRQELPTLRVQPHLCMLWNRLTTRASLKRKAGMKREDCRMQTRLVVVLSDNETNRCDGFTSLTGSVFIKNSR